MRNGVHVIKTFLHWNLKDSELCRADALCERGELRCGSV